MDLEEAAAAGESAPTRYVYGYRSSSPPLPLPHPAVIPLSPKMIKLLKEKNSFIRDVMSKPRLFVVGTQQDLDHLA